MAFHCFDLHVGLGLFYLPEGFRVVFGHLAWTGLDSRYNRRSSDQRHYSILSRSQLETSDLSGKQTSTTLRERRFSVRLSHPDSDSLENIESWYHKHTSPLESVGGH